jgi:hypothetical protein
MPAWASVPEWPPKPGDNPAVTPPRTSAAFVEWLAERYPVVEDLRREHMSDNDELLPHVLFGDVTRYAADLARSGDDDATLIDLLNDLDSALGADRDDQVSNLIWVSFVENAQGVPGDDEEALRVRLRRYPHLAAALKHYE